MTDYDGAAEALADLTDRPRDDFDATDFDIPDFEDQEIEVPDE